MKYLLALVFFLSITACGIQSVESQKLTDESAIAGTTGELRQPVLVELFTSEGCSSCPPAERNLAYFQKEQPFKGAEIIALALHVDYWDYLGWKDKYATALFTQRQRVYDRKFRTGNIYTPQMVVDGEQQFIGSHLKKAEKAVSKALKNKKASIDISVVDERLKIGVSNVPPRKENASVYLAIAEDNLSSEVKSGENAGKSLTHVSVVRELKGLGRLSGNQESFELVVPLQIENDWKKANLSMTVFVQGNQSRKVYGAKRIYLLTETD
ncbi:MAG: DUF1223 domain-containing protein [Pyrinomonadaceae bacterium]|nr:DUF1223 domain-containing protein [Pyrinomonadaceae bacterium]